MTGLTTDVIVCIDDTDDLDSPGTGELASELAATVHRRGWGNSSFVTRHQLYVHPDIPYTSHNSAMCFAAEMDQAALPMFIAYASEFLAGTSAATADPGLCVVARYGKGVLRELVGFGQRAKSELLTKQDAYALASRLGVHLSEHGGTGQGVIGALAGAGLRISGSDGRLKGKLTLGEPGNVVSAGAMVASGKVSAVRGIDGTLPGPDELVWLGEKVKAVLLDGIPVLLVDRVEDAGGGPDGAGGALWRTCTRKQLKDY